MSQIRLGHIFIADRKRFGYWAHYRDALKKDVIPPVWRPTWAWAERAIEKRRWRYIWWGK